MPFKIANHAIRMVFANLEDVLKLTLLPYIAITLLGLALDFAVTGNVTWSESAFDLNPPAEGEAETAQGVATAVVGSLLYLIPYLILTAWLAVGWHRFVLAEEYPTGFVPKWQAGRMVPYIWRFLQVFLTLAITIVGVGVAVMMIGFVAEPLAALVGLAMALVVVVLNVRLSLVLPAVSIDRSDFGIQAAFAATAGFGWMILGAIAVLTLYVFGVLLIVAVLSLISPAFVVASTVLLQWLFLVIGISFLTTLYGVIVEGRQLA